MMMQSVCTLSPSNPRRLSLAVQALCPVSEGTGFDLGCQNSCALRSVICDLVIAQRFGYVRCCGIDQGIRR